MVAAGWVVFGPGPARAHPHVFVDGGVDFQITEDGTLEAIRVTWRYDELETLFLLSDLDVTPAAGADFTDSERALVERELGRFAPDFDGSVHLRAKGEPILLAWPRDLTARMVGDRLEVAFYRDLMEPLALEATELHAAFYERTYFFAFSLTDEPRFGEAEDRCSATITKFEPSSQTDEMRAALAKLGREETPENSNVGALLADRMVVTCK
ncbi:hypothetical protein ATO11_02030 [Pseudaestuariivita atlantica]|uniref:Polyphosphate kinase n=1 Tax=Pseudaestuariivita atlantica TaxID=1317121 RepID=A0A0L1JUM8_9RHOB|nr:hypothetical protein ATO11_02030 [Pseudaestuariivita atlantica]